MRSEMISLNKCRELLDKKREKYTDDQLELIRKYLITLAQINVEIIKNANTKQDDTGSNHEQSEF